jgi:hypothetical protein
MIGKHDYISGDVREKLEIIKTNYRKKNGLTPSTSQIIELLLKNEVDCKCSQRQTDIKELLG